MHRVIDLGAGGDPDPRATETADLHAPADHQVDLAEPWPFETASVDGLVMSHVLEHLADPTHVFDEAGRVLRAGGWFEVTVPVGADYFADPGHEQFWSWSTPTAFCRRHRRRRERHWDPETAFVLEDRECDVRLFGPLRRATPLFQAVAERWPAEAVRRCSAGEITARYRRVDR